MTNQAACRCERQVFFVVVVVSLSFPCALSSSEPLYLTIGVL
jgi:hypothetical protein